MGLAIPSAAMSTLVDARGNPIRSTVQDGGNVVRLRTSDGLANLMTGAGTSVDKRKQAFWAQAFMDPSQIEAAYRTSWLMRKVVDLPPKDMVREWRDWQADSSDIEAIEAEEKRLDLIGKVKQALIFGRLGGGALILGVKQGADPREPLSIDGLGKGALRYLHVAHRWNLSAGPLDMDPASDWFGQPQHYTLSGQGRQVTLHPSRVIPFKGLPVPGLTSGRDQDWFWGDSIVQVVDDAVKDAAAASHGFASLIDEAKVDIIKIPDMMASIASSEYEQKLLRRLDLAQQGKSNHRALVLDGAEEWDTRQITWAGIPDIIKTYLAIVAGAADIPATRLLGKAPDGMNATGGGDLQNYYDMIAANQRLDLAPLLERLDDVLIRSALGSRPADVYYEFAPLWQMSETDRATVMKTKADAIQVYVASGLIPDQALGKAVQNMLVEDAVLPGLEAALAEAEAALGTPDPGAMDPANDPNLTAAERAALQSAGGQNGGA
ncbi:MAG: DUF1073 domain-containing protein [Alphaproteobacteria bacterium]|nr:DUF1073 domain-containing protein [Alphaproteobacteria bacterium]